MRVIGKRDSERVRKLAAMINSSSKADFVRRLLDERRKYLVNDGGGFSTHELAYRDDGRGNAVVYPLVQSVGEGLHRFDDDMAYDRAVYLGDTLNMRTPDAKAFTEGYKSVYPMYFQPELAPVGDLTSAYEMEPPESRGLVPFMYEPGEAEVVEEPVVDLFSDEAKARRRVKQRYAESKFNDKAFNKGSKAQGAWQIVPITYQDYLGRGKGKAGNLDDPEYNGKIRDFVMGIIPRDLKKHWSENDSDLNKLAKLYAAYNWGAGNLRGYFSNRLSKGLSNDDPHEWVEGLNPETKRYVKYLVFDEDFDDGSGYTTKGFEEAAKARGYMAKGGRIHIKPENRGKFTALKKRTGHSASWFKAHGTPAQKKMAVFALNARKWKHGDGGFMHNYFDGETESTGLMQRVPNWVVRGQDYSEWNPSDIQEIINWGYTDPYAFFGQEGEATRDALSRAGMADSVIADIYANAPTELQAQLGDRYKGTAQRSEEYNQGIRDYTDYIAPRLGAVMAGSLLGAEGLSVAAPWLVDVAAPAVSRFLATPTGKIMKAGFDTVGTIDGIRNLASDNGIQKTVRLIDEGRYGRAALSGLGDVFDVIGGIGFIGDTRRYASGVGKRASEALIRMGDDAMQSGSLFKSGLSDASNLGKTGLKKYTHAIDHVKKMHKDYGHTSKQFLDKNTLNYIFNPFADPSLAYRMPYNYSGVRAGTGDIDRLNGKRGVVDRTDDFFGKTDPEEFGWIDKADLPKKYQDWLSSRYPKATGLRTSKINVTRSTGEWEMPHDMRPGEVRHIRTESGGLLGESPDGSGTVFSTLDPGHYGITYTAHPDGSITAIGEDMYKYSGRDWLQTWGDNLDKKNAVFGSTPKEKTRFEKFLDKKFGDGYSDLDWLGKLKYHGLNYVDSKGSPILYTWDYGQVGKVNPKYMYDFASSATPPITPYELHTPTMKSSLEDIDDYIATKKYALKEAKDLEDYESIKDDIGYAEYIKSQKQEQLAHAGKAGNDLDIDAVKWADEDIDDVDSPDMPVFSDWIAMEADKAKTAPSSEKIEKLYEKLKANKAKNAAASIPEDAELPWAYGGLLNRMSKFYNNDRSSMLNLVRKVKAGMN